MTTAPSVSRAPVVDVDAEERARRTNRARYDNVQFLTRLGVVATLGVAVLVVPGVGGHRVALSILLLGVTAPLHLVIRWFAKVPNPTGWLDILAIGAASAGMLIEPSVWTPALVFQMLTLGSALAFLRPRWLLVAAGLTVGGMVATTIVHRPHDGLPTLVMTGATLPVVVMGAWRKYARDRRARTRMQFTLESLPLLVWEADVQTGKLLSMAGNPRPLTGRSLSETRAQRPLSPIHPDDRDRVRRRLVPDHEGQRIKELDYRYLTADGRTMWLHDRVVLAPGGNQRLARGVTFDVTAAKEQELRMLAQATHDHLTGLPNRAALLDRLDAMVTSGRQIGLLLVDLNEFKEINDTLGHLSGDEFLRELGARLQQLADEHGVTVARLGGDEFAFVVPDRSPTDVEAVAQAVWETCRRPVEILGSAIACGASVGIALSPQDARTAENLLRRADLAMYRAKRSHAGTWRFDRSLDRSTDQVELLSELTHAFERDEMVMYYQPIIDLASGELTGAEALVRWDHPTRGLLTPNLFLDLISVGGLSGELARTAIRQTADALAQLPTAFTIAVNLTAQNVRDPELVDDIRHIVDAADIDLSRLRLEITEAHLLDASGSVLENLDRLANAGISIAVDDFGTGYSSLTHLRSLPISQLKIDRQFVTSMLEREQDHVIVQSMINLAHDLGLRVTAEGVETAAVAQRLAELGCDLGQGFLWGRPAPLDDCPVLAAAESTVAGPALEVQPADAKP